MSKALTLKEVYFREEQDPGGSSRFVASMRKQFSRATDLEYIASVYDRILQLLETPTEQQQEVLKGEEPLFKFHFRIAFREHQSGALDPNAAPSGSDIMKQEIEKREVAQATPPADPNAGLSPGEAQRRAVYGGDPRDANRTTGLGS